METARNIFSFTILKFILFAAIIFLIPARGIFAGENPVKDKKRFTVSLSFSPFYDSNILKYSEKYIERFRNLEDKGRFHIQTTDDLVFGYSLGISFTGEIIGKLKTSVGAGYDSDAYAYNSIKTWSKYNIFFRQNINNSTSFYLSYSYLPEFYVRHFRDEDWVRYYGYAPDTFRPYVFSKDDFSFWAQHLFSWKTTRVRAYFSYMRYFLDESNTEYDSNDFLYGFRIFQAATDYLDVNFGYSYITSDAKGFDEPAETREISDDSDATNYEHVYIAGFDLKLPAIFSLKNIFSVDVQYQRAFYTTDNYIEMDPLHAGRYDYNYRVFVNYNWDIFKNFSLTAFYHWMGRESGSPSDINKEYISDEKDYTQYRAGISFNYLIRF